MALSLALRSMNPSSLYVEIGVWDDQSRLQPIARKEMSIKSGEWTRQSLHFPVPAEQVMVGVFLYLPNKTGERIWFDDARLEPVR